MNFKHDGREKSLSFGAYPLVRLVAAREKRDEARRLLANGVDPWTCSGAEVHGGLAGVRAP
ncbi:Arm DNA-binding domain-containing protein [Sphingobium sp. AS12]|uniref:Arm DNA-binding domain-containing protein n=1 Tax=Sphingobium sp. AS12 TaxID=2849495 RepID=UPI001C312CFD|nr:Arm DNA-binding domain-containing protein [Sphingobium sp. AS12]MBV2147709.1 Arm DNA-binding domain-containing protein [Sphingobium sp. AS12]